MDMEKLFPWERSCVKISDRTLAFPRPVEHDKIFVHYFQLGPMKKWALQGIDYEFV